MKREGIALLTPLQAEMAALTITTLDDYEAMSVILRRIRDARVKWDGKITPGIDHIRKGLDILYELRRDVDGPLEQMEKDAKAAMKRWDLAQAEQKRLADEAVWLVAQRLREAAQRQEAAQAKAQTPQLKAKLQQARERFEDQAAAVESQVVETAPVRVIGSSRRRVKKWRIDDMPAFILAVCGFKWEGADLMELDIAQQPPVETMMVDSAHINGRFKGPEGQALVASWPGVTVFDDIDINVRG